MIIVRYIDNRIKRIWLLLTVISLLGVIDIPSSTVLGVAPLWRWCMIIAISGLKATLLTALLLWTENKKYLSSVIRAALVCYALVCVINALIFGLFGMGVTVKLFTVIGQTNRAEVAGFIPTLPEVVTNALGNIKLYLAVAGVAVFWILISKLPGRLFLVVTSLLSVGGIVSMVCVFGEKSGRSNFCVTLRLARSVVMTCNEKRSMDHELEKLTALPYADTVKSFRLADVVMVVGESASRSRLSLYGYSLPTTPLLDSMRDSLIVFDDVIGTSTITAYNMDRILTFLSDRDDASEWYKSPMLFSLMNEAGYETSWLSNQEKGGLWGNSTAAMVSMADNVRFVGSISTGDATLEKHDEVLIPALEETLRSDGRSKFIGVHLLGSHTPYRRRYPAGCAVFNSDSVLSRSVYNRLSASQARTVAEYDNSIRYTDSLLSEIIGMVARQERPAVMIYFSDHGENVYDNGGDYVGRDDRHVEVPFIIYANPLFAGQNPRLLSRLREVSHCPMTTASLCHLLCTLTGTDYKMYADTLDITSPAYLVTQRYVDGKLWK